MKRAVFLGVLVGALASCGPPTAQNDAFQHSETRQVPSSQTPGIHISGNASVGVVKRF